MNRISSGSLFITLLSIQQHTCSRQNDSRFAENKETNMIIGEVHLCLSFLRLPGAETTGCVSLTSYGASIGMVARSSTANLSALASCEVRGGVSA